MSITPFFHVYHKYVFIMANINKIKLSGTTYNIQDLNATKTVELTQAEYDALSVKDPNTFYIITDATAGDLSNYYTKSETDNAITAATSTKQDTLVSGTNIKTINGETLLGEGNIEIQGGGGGGKAIEAGRGISITTGETADTINCTVPASASSGNYSIMFGQPNLSDDARGSKSITGGQWSKAYAEGSVAIGQMNESKSPWAWAVCNGTMAVGKSSFACGEHNSTNNTGEFACGYANVTNGGSDTSIMTLFTVGNGTYKGGYQRHNALDIRMNGDIYIPDTNDTSTTNYYEKPMIKLQDALGGGGSSYTAGDGIDINNDVISVTGKVDTSTYESYTAATDTALASKQTTLTAGTGISIVDNVISATGGGGGGLTEDDELLLSTALTDLNDRKIDASEVKANYQKKGDYATKYYVTTALEPYETKLDEINTEEVTAYALNDLNNRFGGLKIAKITESEYAALTTKDENTLYVVVADPS